MNEPRTATGRKVVRIYGGQLYDDVLGIEAEAASEPPDWEDVAAMIEAGNLLPEERAPLDGLTVGRTEPRTEAGRMLLVTNDDFGSNEPGWVTNSYEDTLASILAIEAEVGDADRLAWAGGLAMGMSQGPEMGALTRGVHRWFCGDGVKHGDKLRPHIGWACERGAASILATLRDEP